MPAEQLAAQKILLEIPKEKANELRASLRVLKGIQNSTEEIIFSIDDFNQVVQESITNHIHKKAEKGKKSTSKSDETTPAITMQCPIQMGTRVIMVIETPMIKITDMITTRIKEIIIITQIIQTEIETTTTTTEIAIMIIEIGMITTEVATTRTEEITTLIEAEMATEEDIILIEIITTLIIITTTEIDITLTEVMIEVVMVITTTGDQEIREETRETQDMIDQEIANCVQQQTIGQVNVDSTLQQQTNVQS